MVESRFSSCKSYGIATAWDGLMRGNSLHSFGAQKNIVGYRGGGVPLCWYKPGGLLTEQTGRIVDTLRHGRDVLERCYALENEQCDGRTSAFCL
jgi:hypothetical protein